MIDSAYQDLIDFHRACDVPVLSGAAIPSPDRVKLRRDLLAEEYGELDRGVEAGDLVEIADGLVDMIYIAIGTALEYGIDLPAVWDEIHASNMRKVDPATGKVEKREDGKVMKPAGWTPPNVRAALGLDR